MLFHANALLVVMIALLADAVIGDPDAVWRRWPHPVTWIGWLIGRLDSGLNHDDQTHRRRKIMGCVALVLLLLISGMVAFALDAILRALPGHPWTTGLIASVLIAQNSLYVHVARVRDAFSGGGLNAARQAVAMIVGRNPDSLDEAGLARAAIETTAENFSDGVVAPVFWFVLLGLPGLVLYKAINTADSMIGHRSSRHEAFGWAAAKLDDGVNLVPARIAGVLVALAAPLVGGSPAHALKVMLRDARLHKSPNAGWPEAAMAGALGVALAGPRRYGDRLVDDAFLNATGRVQATATDIASALRVLAGACLLQFALVAALALEHVLF
jgi:adenosylcobinamide-phosphate synthase